ESAWGVLIHAVHFPIFVILAICCAGIGCFAIIGWLGSRGSKMLYAATTLFFVAAALGGATVCREREYRQAQATPVVVVSLDGVRLRSGNGLSYPVKFETPLNRGVEA